jgi:hypothetical protein
MKAFKAFGEGCLAGFYTGKKKKKGWQLREET